MKKIFLIGLLSFAYYQLVDAKDYQIEPMSINGYSVETIDEHPIPEDTYFQLLDALATEFCQINNGAHGYSIQSCNHYKEVKLNKCKNSYLFGTHVFVSSTAEHERLGLAYLDCILPIAYVSPYQVILEP
ncbi:hypothetical protein HR060_10895 [Catenovulum sp. SM1970]|uniref:hypothetical protein n=1 Tax=Marinifaba aquimaris TaxID=2741323 RepID=UPI00157343CD|nr:hypothetical protein [Marinifaba aquimaris]NTS77367.1 hypothetical protein [Marinifaba aquimaris]